MNKNYKLLIAEQLLDTKETVAEGWSLKIIEVEENHRSSRK